jgi:sulfate adenylyltransferase
MKSIEPHGGKLVDREVKGEKKEALAELAGGLKRIILNPRQVSDLELIASGAFSPLEGFMGREDYESVLQNMRLSRGLPWTIPVTLSVAAEEAERIRGSEEIALEDGSGRLLAVLRVSEIFSFDKEREAFQVYATTDIKHPGVKYLTETGDTAIAGKITLLAWPSHDAFFEYRLNPRATRRIFGERGWKRIVGFQTRNPVHRAHEHIQKCALEVVDGLLLHPLVGETKEDDIPAEVRMKCYEVLLESYYPKERVLLAVLPAAMRYAGPKEAIFHAIVRKNYGCTHFIVGRDHAGVGNYYGSFDAHHIFDEFEPQELGIVPLFFDYTFYCHRCAGMVSYKTCPHDSASHVSLSGTKVREMLQRGERPPAEFTRPEVADVLIEWATRQNEYVI